MENRIKVILVAVTIALLPLGAVAQTNSEKIETTRENIRQWVETKQLISKTRTDWREQKAILENSIKMLEIEIAELDTALDGIETESSASEDKRRELGEREEELSAASEVVEEALSSLEASIHAIYPSLAKPLQERISPIYKSLPKKGEDVSFGVGQRLAPVIAIMNEIDKFNQVITVEDDIREVEGGEKVSVTVVYLGNSAGYFVDEDGEFAYRGEPGPDGWTWTAEPKLASKIQRAINIYNQAIKPAEFILLPVNVK